MIVTIEDDRVVSVAGDPDHPFTDGFLCHKVSRFPERVNHPDRLMYPLRRTGPKGSGQFERITWDAALAEIADRFRAIADGPHGPQAILPYSYCGTMGKIQSEGLDRRFFHRLGASLLDRTICATAGVAGISYTLGSTRGMDSEAIVNSRYIINWGSNTAVTNSHLWAKMVQARKAGAKIVTIDPYRSPTAVRSDWHLPIRPGSDGALALGMMHILFRDGRQDDDYLTTACIGADALRDRVLREYPPERVASITGLDVASIEQLAGEYAETAPAAIRVNYGASRHAGGGMAIRTIACLPAIIGAWRHRSGGVLLSTSSLFPFNLQGLQRPDLIPTGTGRSTCRSLPRHCTVKRPDLRWKHCLCTARIRRRSVRIRIECWRACDARTCLPSYTSSFRQTRLRTRTSCYRQRHNSSISTFIMRMGIRGYSSTVPVLIHPANADPTTTSSAGWRTVLASSRTSSKSPTSNLLETSCGRIRSQRQRLSKA